MAALRDRLEYKAESREVTEPNRITAKRIIIVRMRPLELSAWGEAREKEAAPIYRLADGAGKRRNRTMRTRIRIDPLASMPQRLLKYTKPNQAMQPTPVAVTPRAVARAAPSTSVADLER